MEELLLLGLEPGDLLLCYKTQASAASETAAGSGPPTQSHQDLCAGGRASSRLAARRDKSTAQAAPPEAAKAGELCCTLLQSCLHCSTGALACLKADRAPVRQATAASSGSALAAALPEALQDLHCHAGVPVLWQPRSSPSISDTSLWPTASQAEASLHSSQLHSQGLSSAPQSAARLAPASSTRPGHTVTLSPDFVHGRQSSQLHPPAARSAATGTARHSLATGSARSGTSSQPRHAPAAVQHAFRGYRLASPQSPSLCDDSHWPSLGEADARTQPGVPSPSMQQRSSAGSPCPPPVYGTVLQGFALAARSVSESSQRYSQRHSQASSSPAGAAIPGPVYTSPASRQHRSAAPPARQRVMAEPVSPGTLPASSATASPAPSLSAESVLGEQQATQAQSSSEAPAAAAPAAEQQQPADRNQAAGVQLPEHVLRAQVRAERPGCMNTRCAADILCALCRPQLEAWTAYHAWTLQQM